MSLTRFTAIDLETTGLDPKRDRIIEIGAVRFENGAQTASFSSFLNPGRVLPWRITELTGITDAQLQGQPDFQQVADELLCFLGEDALLGHNILFDYAFLKKAFALEKIPFERKAVDTLKIARVCLPELKSRRLGSLCEYYDIHLQAHRALGDASAAGQLYLRMTEQFEQARAVEAAALEYRVKKDSPATKAQKEQLTRLLLEHQMESPYEIEKMTRSEASRFLEEILQKVRQSQAGES